MAPGPLSWSEQPAACRRYTASQLGGLEAAQLCHPPPGLSFPICKTKASRLLAALQTQHLRILVSGAPAVWKMPSQQVQDT